MRRFRFRLARVLSLRQRQVELSEARLMAHDRSVQNARDDANRLADNALAAAIPPPVGARLPASQLAASDGYAQSLRRKSQQRQQAAEHLAAQKTTMLADHLALRRNLATLESLYTREYKKHQQAQDRAAEAQAIETHLAKRYRTPRRKNS